MAGLEKTDIRIRTLIKKDLSDAEHIFRLAFGTWHGLPDPLQFGGDSSHVRSRWLIDPNGSFGAEYGGRLLGSNFVADWGSVGFFGPLTVLPEFWDKGVAQVLLEVTMERFKQNGAKHTGLFTFPNSPKHIALYQKFGYHPHYLTGMMTCSVKPKNTSNYVSYYSDLRSEVKENVLNACREVTHSIFEGLDLTLEISAVDIHRLGDTVLCWDNTNLVAFAVCHVGAHTEAGSDTCYVKFGAVKQCPSPGKTFEGLLDACETMAAHKGVSRMLVGMNTSRREAYEKMLERGYHNDMLGVIMHRPNEPGYNRPRVYLIDDWR